MRPTAEIGEVALGIGGQGLIFEVCYEFELEGFLDEEVLGFVAGENTAGKCLVSLDDLLHLLLDLFEVFGCEGGLAVKVVVEASVYCRADGDLCAGEEFEHCLCHDVSCGVPENLLALVVVKGEELDCAVFFEWLIVTDDHAVELSGKDIPCKPLRDALGYLNRGNPFFLFQNGSVRELYFNHNFPFPVQAV